MLDSSCLTGVAHRRPPCTWLFCGGPLEVRCLLRACDGRLQPRGKRQVGLGHNPTVPVSVSRCPTRRKRQCARLRLARFGLFDNASEMTELLVLDVARVSVVARLQTQCVTTECKIARQPLRKQ